MSVPLHSAILPQDHFEINLPADPHISPDGRFIAYTRTRADEALDRRFVAEFDIAVGHEAQRR